MIKTGDKVCIRQTDGQICDNTGWRYKYKWSDDTAKVMAVVDGYAMLRFRSCMPFVKALKELNKLGVE